MRLKEDSYSYRAEGLKTKLKQIPEQPVHRSKKNTKKWCKGKVGVPHNYVLFKKWETSWYCFRINKCTNCGKKQHV